MSVWRDDDPPFNLGKPRESHLARRLYRLRRLEQRRPLKFKEQAESAYKEWLAEFNRNLQIDQIIY
jgi:hypothetical protein